MYLAAVAGPHRPVRRPKTRGSYGCLVLWLLACNSGPDWRPPAQTRPLGQRDTTLTTIAARFSQSAYGRARLRPDGSALAFQDRSGRIWLEEYDLKKTGVVAKTRRLLRDTGTLPIVSFQWSADGRELVYVQKVEADRTRVRWLDITSGVPHRVNVPDARSVTLVETSATEAGLMLLRVHYDDRKAFVHYRSHTRQFTDDSVNDLGFTDIALDQALNPRVGLKAQPDGSIGVYWRTKTATWQRYTRLHDYDALTAQLVTYDAHTDRVLWVVSRDRDTTALVWTSITANDNQVVAAGGDDITQVTLSPARRTPDAVAYHRHHQSWQPVAQQMAPDLVGLRAHGNFKIVDRSRDDSVWLVKVSSPHMPPRLGLWLRAQRKLHTLEPGHARNAPPDHAYMQPITVPTARATNLIGYHTPAAIRPGSDGRPSPALLIVDEGPWERPYSDYNPLHMVFRERGYAVVSIAPRGALGLGKHYAAAGGKYWDTAVVQDVLAATRWLAAQPNVDKKKICVVGKGYGGYAALMAAATAPEPSEPSIACTASIGGVLNLPQLAKTLHDAGSLRFWQRHLGRLDRKDDIRALWTRSPLTHVDKLRIPTFLAYADLSASIDIKTAERFGLYLHRRGVPVTMLRFPDESHVFHRRPNFIAALTALEAFLSTHIGGKYRGEQLPRTSMTIATGSQWLPGLSSFERVP